MKRPNVKNERIYEEYPLSVEDMKTGKWYSYMLSKENSTIFRSLFEEDASKVARAFAMDRQEMKDLSKKLKMEFSENKYFVIEDLKTKELMGFLKIESVDRATLIIKYPFVNKVNEKLNQVLKKNFRARVTNTINDFAIKIKITLRTKEFATR